MFIFIVSLLVCLKKNMRRNPLNPLIFVKITFLFSLFLLNYMCMKRRKMGNMKEYQAVQCCKLMDEKWNANRFSNKLAFFKRVEENVYIY